MEFLKLVTGLTIMSLLFAGFGIALAMWTTAEQEEAREPFSIAIIANE